MNLRQITPRSAIKPFLWIALAGLLSGCATQKLPERQYAELWGEPLPAVEALDTVATDKDAVFIYVQAPEAAMTAAEQSVLEDAAAQVTGSGMVIGIYELQVDSEDYQEAQNAFNLPCVLALRKGAGMDVVDGEVSVERLVQALAGSHGGCGSGGCGPSGCR